MRKKVLSSLLESVGRTPLVYMDRLTADALTQPASGEPVRIAAKLEFGNPTGSAKDRIACGMISDAEKRGFLVPGSTVIEPTSGNTGVSLAFVCAQKGYRVILTMPDSVTIERRRILSALGAELIFTPAESGMRGAIEKAEELIEQLEGAFMPQQFSNPSNPEAHEKTTAVEIWDETGGEVDVVVAGVGTGGTITGIGNYLRRKRKHVRLVAVEPARSAVLSGGSAGNHRIQGIGAGFIPKVLNRGYIDEVIAVSDEDAVAIAKRLAATEGILAGISSGAAAWAALHVAARVESQGKLIVVIFPDGGEKYMSMGLTE